MNERTMQRRVGIVALATLVIGGLLIGLNSQAPLAWLPWGRGTYPIRFEVDQAPGVAANTPVRKNGLLIGRVASVEDMPDQVVITASIDDGVELFPQYDVQVRTTMLGDSTIELFRAPVPPGTPPLPPDSSFRARVISSNPLDMISGLQGDLTRMITAMGRAGDEVALLGRQVNEILSDEQGQQRFSELLDKTSLALDDFSRTMRSVEDVFGDVELRDNLRRGVADFPKAVGDLRVTMQEAQQALGTIEEVAGSVDSAIALAEQNLKNLEDFTQSLGTDGPQITQALLVAADGIDKMVEEVTVFTSALTSSEGTLGKLIADRELYERLNKLAFDANTFVWRLTELTRQVGPPLRKAVIDASVFTDKIAREPGRVIGGALNRGPNVK